MTEFVHLHVHSEYSLLDGLAHPQAIAARAKEYGMPAVALTDHGTMFAAIEFYDACRAHDVKPLIGVEAYLATRTIQDRDPKLDRSPYHLLLLAENETGYKNLLKLTTLAQFEGFYQKPRVDKALLEKYNAGLIVTTGCIASEIPQLLVQGKTRQARETLAWYAEVFQDRLYVEMQEHGIPELTRINPELIALAREFGLKLVATNDVHYLSAEDWFAQDVLLCIQTGSTINTPDRLRMDGRDYWFKSPAEMAAVWRDLPEVLTNTLEVAERCNVDLSFQGYHLPHFPVPKGYTPAGYLRALCERGFAQRYPNPTPAQRERLDYELDVIHRMGFDTYFLIVWDLTDYARRHGIWCNARGSAAGSIVAYCLGITNLDPLEHNLIFERFLNPDRISMPDIDLDFPDDAREEMIRYTVEKYGKDNVAQIITFGKMLAKAAIRDVGRALDYPLSEVDRVAKLIPGGPGQTIDGALEHIKEFRELYESSDYLRKLIDNAKLLEGVVRNASTHAAGVVVTDRPVIEYTPLHRPTHGDESGTPVTQFPMGDLERIGLLKIDYLGLAHLTVVREACRLIKERHGVEYDLQTIPVEDAQAFELLSRGDVTGLFQVEGAGMKRVLMQMRPTKFDHIVAAISLYRPGPMDYIPSYIARMHGQEKIQYRHPALEPILAETFGIMIYQEQIMRIARECCGYSGGEADTLRKAVGKKKKEEILKQREKFIRGAEQVGIIPPEIAAQIFDDIEYFARYGFNKSHGAVYAVLTCQTAFLKAHYPLEYLAALMCTDAARIERIALYVADARRMGIPILPPDVRYSNVNFTIEVAPDGSPGIRFGLKAIKNVGESAVEVIVKARGHKPFTSLDDFCTRVDLKQVNRRTLESLIKAGALDAFGHRAQLLEAIDRMISVSAAHHQASAIGQLSLFGGTIAAEAFGALPQVKEIDHKTRLEWERELIGIYFSEHPLLKLVQSSKKHVSAYIGELSPESDGQAVTIGGMITSLRTIVTKKGDPMAFLQVEDAQGSIEVVAFPRTFNDCREVIRPDALVLVRGKVQAREEKLAILADWIGSYPLDDAPSPTYGHAKRRHIPRETGIFRDGASEAPGPADRPLPGGLERTADAPSHKMPIPRGVHDGASPTQGVRWRVAVEAYDEYIPNTDQVLDDWLPLPSEWDSAEGMAGDDAFAQKVQAGSQPAPAPDTPITDTRHTDLPNGTDAPAERLSTPAERLSTPAERLSTPAERLSTPAERLSTPPLPDLKLGSGITIPSKINNNANGQAYSPPSSATQLVGTSLPAGNASMPTANTLLHNGDAPSRISRETGIVRRRVIAQDAYPTRDARSLVGDGASDTSRASVAHDARMHGTRRVRVHLSRTNDTDLDTRRMREVVALLRSAEGRDRFALVVPYHNSLVELDFPNFYTNYDLIAERLLELVGEWGQVQVLVQSAESE